MPRRRRFLPVGMPAHIIQRGVNKQICFAGDHDMAAYANWLSEGAKKFDVSIHAWVLMTNHVHLLMTPNREGAISECMQYLGRFYVRYFNYRYGRTGTLFEDRFKSHLVQSSAYFLTCARYIELNPVRAGMVRDPADYTWSSYAAQALGKDIKMWTPHGEYVSLGTNKDERRMAYCRLFENALSLNDVSKIKSSQKTGFILSTESFRSEFESLTGVTQSHGKKGRKLEIL